jgi:DNA helicase-2/ATP-dependent DNA helicase PcrA
MNDQILSHRTYTEAQAEAIFTPEPYVACVAGPGSGKTTVLVERIKRLIAEGWKPGRMVVITFTNAAAREIEKRLGRSDLHYAGTLHGYMLRLLRDHGREIRMGSRVAVMNEDESDDLLLGCIEELKAKHVTPRELRELRAVTDPEPMLFPEKGAKPLTGPALVLSHYFRKCIEAAVVDFDTILKFGAMILRRVVGPNFKNVPGVEITNFVTHLFWDEVQDSGGDDWEIMRLLSADNFFIVGDPDQSIYGFRGARPDLFLRELRGGRRGWHVIKLEENFRCLPEICGAANALIGNNRDRVPKDCVPVNYTEEGSVERWLALENDAQEGMAMVQALRKAPNLSECAVLVRNHALRERVVKNLQAYSIPVVTKESHGKPLDWQKARSLLSLMTNPENDLLFFRMLVQRYGEASAKATQLDALRRGMTLNRFQMHRSEDHFPERVELPDVPALLARHGVGPESVERISKAISELPAGATLSELAYALGDEELHKKEVGESAGVTVTTMHAAKGREWDTVILPGFEEGICPSGAKSADLEEERRLAFVAFTRARRLLIVSNVGQRVPLFGSRVPKDAEPSRFISEAGLLVT